jgi:hypothetical protein
MRALFTALACAMSSGLAAQRPTIIKLPPADARLETAFTAITSIRELSDGRILVTDPRDLQLVVADFRSGDVRQISRRGGGPGEYGMATPVQPIGGDSSLMVDIMQRRWLLLHADRMVATVSQDNPVVRATRGFAFGTDRVGHVLTVARTDPPDGRSVTTMRDSTLLLLVHRGSGRTDTVTRILDRPTTRTVTRNAKGEVTFSSSRALRLRVGEQYELHEDGWLAVIRINPFRVDWRSPEGHWTLGAALPVPIIRMNDREKQASLARTARSMAANPSSTPFPPQLVTPDDDWPDVMPPYVMGETIFSPEGHVIFRRQPSADQPGVAYYVVDRRGRLVGMIEMKDNERLFAAGARSIYVVETDADDLRYVRRHPWPHSTLPPG